MTGSNRPNPVQVDYIPQGTVFLLGDLPVYETPQNGSKKLIILNYDMFGLHPVTQQLADALAGAGYRVAIPDYFRGGGFPLDNFPPKDRQEIINFLTEKGSWRRTTKADVAAVLNHYKENEGISIFGTFGLCWGSRVTRNALAEFPEFQVGAFVYPTFWRIEEAFQVHKPLLMIASSEQENMIPFFDILKERLGGNKCAHYRFDDMQHGFASARADLTDGPNVRRIEETLDLLHRFFSTHLGLISHL